MKLLGQVFAILRSLLRTRDQGATQRKSKHSSTTKFPAFPIPSNLSYSVKMNDSLHSRNPPKASASSGTPYQLILEHVFQQSGTYEIPLRTMYAINCSPIAQSKPRSDIRLASPPPTYAPPAVPGSQQVPLAPATAQFTSALIDHIASLPTQPCSLPTPFITTFLRRCFCAEYALVDFSQALTGLDYLKDLETKRRRATAAAFTKLGLDKESLGTSADQISAFSPPVAAWHKSITDSERKVEALYTQVYIGLRRWVCSMTISGLPHPLTRYRSLSTNYKLPHSISTTV